MKRNPVIVIAAPLCFFTALVLICHRATDDARIKETAFRDTSTPTNILRINPDPGSAEGSKPTSDRRPMLRHAESEPSVAGVATQRSSPPAIRLADDHQLPAAAMPELAAAGHDAQGGGRNTENVSAGGQVAAARSQIVDGFYADLIHQLDSDAQPPGTEIDPETGEETVVIPPGYGDGSARQRANEHYRTLFGQDAYNSKLLAAALESRLEAP
jgi:hypothetical protein